MCLPGTENAFGGPDRAARTAQSDSPPPAFAGGNRLDLTHVIRAGFPVSIFDPPSREPALRFDEHGYYSQTWRLQEHTATHVDAPAHFYSGAMTSPEITPESLVVNVVVVDIRERAAADPDVRLEPSDLIEWEGRHGRIPPHAGVFMNSGWDARAGDAKAFPNADEEGRFHSPGFHADAAEWLLENRDVVCFGVDTLSLDHGPSQTYPSHRAILGTGRYGIEGLARLAELPPVGAVASIGLIPFEDGSGGPARVLAAW